MKSIVELEYRVQGVGFVFLFVFFSRYNVQLFFPPKQTFGLLD